MTNVLILLRILVTYASFVIGVVAKSTFIVESTPYGLLKNGPICEDGFTLVKGVLIHTHFSTELLDECRDCRVVVLGSRRVAAINLLWSQDAQIQLASAMKGVVGLPPPRHVKVYGKITCMYRLSLLDRLCFLFQISFDGGFGHLGRAPAEVFVERIEFLD
ncbi:MAG: hypothetical protein MUF01_03420 [Bryobacterales bacterium]|jgi:hypothetical protein|nr:hypothetical protein [Bryobacterales bacterium]